MRKYTTLEFTMDRNGVNRGKFESSDEPTIGKNFEYVDDEYYYCTSVVLDILEKTDDKIVFRVLSGSVYTLT